MLSLLINNNNLDSDSDLYINNTSLKEEYITYIKEKPANSKVSFFINYYINIYINLI